MKTRHFYAHAFSLVELSIVLVILGLLVGGVLTGQSLIRAAELRSVATDYQRYTTAVYTFRDKYMAAPGDITNATAFWGTAANCPGTSAQGSVTVTCNGDGNGVLSESAPTSNELFRFWQHLANAGLIEGQYNGVTGGGSNGYTALPGTNVPRGKLSSSGWSLYNWGAIAGVNDTAIANRFEGNYGNGDVLLFGGAQANYFTGASIFKSEELWNIDTKADDGRPGLGKLRIFEWMTGCHTATPSTTVAVASTAEYRLDNNSVACFPLVILYP